jgi:hypothetical protein
MLATMTEPTTYNGWRNRATWCLNLHLGDLVTSWIIDDKDEWSVDDVDQASSLFQDLLEEQIEQSDLTSFPLLWELLDTSDIDFYSLGKAALEAAFS